MTTYKEEYQKRVNAVYGDPPTLSEMAEFIDGTGRAWISGVLGAPADVIALGSTLNLVTSALKSGAIDPIPDSYKSVLDKFGLSPRWPFDKAYDEVIKTYYYDKYTHDWNKHEKLLNKIYPYTSDGFLEKTGAPKSQEEGMGYWASWLGFFGTGTVLKKLGDKWVKKNVKGIY